VRRLAPLITDNLDSMCWCLLQILFDKQHTPMFDTGLTLGMRLLYTSGA
jgi:hypothetical protein